MIILSAFAVILGSISQRVAGLGFALLVAPIFVLTFGPYDGVVLINFGGTISSIVVLLRMWRDINWRRYAVLGPAAILAILPTSYLVVNYNGPILQIVIGAILLLGLTIALSRAPAIERQPRWWTTATAGAAAGISSAAAGVGAPPMGMYAAGTGWNQREFAATLQPVFVTTGATSFISKVTIAQGVPDIPWPMWVGTVLLSFIGLGLGEWVKGHISAPRARAIAFALCFAGALAATVDGAVELLQVDVAQSDPAAVHPDWPT